MNLRISLGEIYLQIKNFLNNVFIKFSKRR